MTTDREVRENRVQKVGYVEDVRTEESSVTLHNVVNLRMLYPVCSVQICWRVGWAPRRGASRGKTVRASGKRNRAVVVDGAPCL